MKYDVAMDISVHRHGFFCRESVQHVPRLSLSPFRPHGSSDLKVTSLRIPRDNTVNHTNRSVAFFRRAFLRAMQKYACTEIFVTSSDPTCRIPRHDNVRTRITQQTDSHSDR